MKNSLIILLNAILLIICYFITMAIDSIHYELLYFSIALLCTHWIVKAIEDK